MNISSIFIYIAILFRQQPMQTLLETLSRYRHLMTDLAASQLDSILMWRRCRRWTGLQKSSSNHLIQRNLSNQFQKLHPRKGLQFVFLKTKRQISSSQVPVILLEGVGEFLHQLRMIVTILFHTLIAHLNSLQSLMCSVTHQSMEVPLSQILEQV